MTRAVLLAAALFLVAASAVRAGYDEGMAAYQRGDFVTAANEFLPLARDGDVRAQRNLGYLYEKGKGVPQDHREAVSWYRKAAEKGDPKAQFNLAIMYFNGDGIVRNYRQAAAWFRKAADQGHTKAQYSLGSMASTGRGILTDVVEAYLWFSLASRSGDKGATYALRRLVKRMTPAQIDRARRMIQKWLDERDR
ncbi:MAG: tetratricopeptide repeat protein [Rhodospirillales bacterium]